MGRLEYMDSLKGVCILLIVAAHCGVVVPAAAAVYAMPCFFIIGGFFYKDGQGGIKQFLIHKLNRILIPFAFFLSDCLCSVLRIKMVLSQFVGD